MIFQSVTKATRKKKKKFESKYIFVDPFSIDYNKWSETWDNKANFTIIFAFVD